MSKPIASYEDPLLRFFAYARERHSIYLRRSAGVPRAEWTKDAILREHRFTNVFRELDKTTAWFRKHVRDPLRDKPEVLLATVLFRMLNRIEVGEAVFLQGGIMSGDTAFHEYLSSGDWHVLKRAIVNYVGKRGPYVTGAYIISTPPGKVKLDGALWIVDNFRKNSGMREWLDNDPAGNECSLQAAFEWIGENDYLGKFHSYEIVTDLRHTKLLERAPDIMTWANMGPGARRGLNRIHNRTRDTDGRGKWGPPIPEEQALQEMRDILRYSRNEKLWTKKSRDWPAWELREVEHTLCEFDKYERVRLGEGRPRGVFR